MAPLLIDNNGILKLAIIAAIAAMIIFAGGFYLGYHQAGSYQIAHNDNHSLFSSKKAITKDADVEPKPSEKIVESNVDAVGSTASVKKLVQKSVQNTPGNSVAIKHEEIQVPVSRKQLTSAETPAKNKKAETKLIADDLRAQAKYSIQVGFYGRLDNARKKVDKLQQENLDAYVSDYLNKNNEIRFNVRFGYFVDKSAANRALKTYNKNHKSDGYLVNYAGDKLTHSNEENNFSDVKLVSDIDSNAGVQEIVSSGTVDAGNESAPMIPIKAQTIKPENASVTEIEKTVNH